MKIGEGCLEKEMKNNKMKEMKLIYDMSTISSMPCVATIGSFDGVHRGHRFLIDRVKDIAIRKAYISAVITFSVPPQQVMNPSFVPNLLSTYDEKVDMLAHTGIDECIVLDFTKQLSDYTAYRFMCEILKKKYNVEYLVIGYDHRFGHDRSEGYNDYIRYGKEMGISVEAVPVFQWNGKIISSSSVRHLLREGNVNAAADALGYSYFINGTVERGHQIGRQIGFPTANLSVDNKDKLIPKGGVYAVNVQVGEKEYGGMLNIGYRPTVSKSSNCTIEVNILDFDENIYNSHIRISFIERIRSERKFDTIEALKNQLHKDKKQVKNILLSRY